MPSLRRWRRTCIPCGLGAGLNDQIRGAYAHPSRAQLTNALGPIINTTRGTSGEGSASLKCRSYREGKGAFPGHWVSYVII